MQDADTSQAHKQSILTYLPLPLPVWREGRRWEPSSLPPLSRPRWRPRSPRSKASSPVPPPLSEPLPDPLGADGGCVLGALGPPPPLDEGRGGSSSICAYGSACCVTRPDLGGGCGTAAREDGRGRSACQRSALPRPPDPRPPPWPFPVACCNCALARWPAERISVDTTKGVLEPACEAKRVARSRESGPPWSVWALMLSLFGPFACHSSEMGEFQARVSLITSNCGFGWSRR